MAKRRKRKRSGPKRYYSKKQWRWAFANKKEWAHRQAHRTPGGPKVRYRRLPMRSRKRKSRR